MLIGLDVIPMAHAPETGAENPEVIPIWARIRLVPQTGAE